MKKLVVKSFAYGIVEPNFYGHFKDLPKDRMKQLDLVSTSGKIKELEKAEVRLEGLISYNDLSIRLARSTRWVKVALKDLKIRHVKVIDKRKYFDQGVVDILTDYIDLIAREANPGRKPGEKPKQGRPRSDGRLLI